MSSPFGLGSRAVPCAFVVAVHATLFTSPSAAAQETVRVDVDAAGVQTNDASYQTSLSADGRFVAFASSATNLVPGDTNGAIDVFVHDRTTGAIERVSVDSSGVAGNGDSSGPSLSADGRFVAFCSRASNLVAGDANKVYDVFVRDRSTGVTERVSVDSSGVEGNDGSCMYEAPSLSADGRIVVFSSFASNLVAGDTNQVEDVFVHDRSTGVTERVSVSGSGVQGDDYSGYGSASATSSDGRFIAFQSNATNLVAGDTNGMVDVFVRDRSTGLIERVSVDSSGAEGDGVSYIGGVSADGRLVAFLSGATNLVAGDSNGWFDVFVHDRVTGITDRESVDSAGNQASGGCALPAISADGRCVTFSSWSSDLDANDVNGVEDQFIHVRASGLTECVSVDSTGVRGNGESGTYFAPALSADGNVVGFSSDATNLVANDTNGFIDIFVHERCSSLASWSNYGAGFPGMNGIPSFTSQANPVLDTTIALDLANSLGAFTVGVVFVGFQRTKVHSNWGGDLLVAPSLVSVVGLQPAGITISGAIPNDDRLCGVTVDLQAIEADPGATHGVSFTPGLELVLGK